MWALHKSLSCKCNEKESLVKIFHKSLYTIYFIQNCDTMAKKLIGILAFAIAIMILMPVNAVPPANWKRGDEAKILRPSHTFDEEYWTAEVSNTTDKGETITISVSYINTRSVQAFLVALKDIKKGEDVSTLPWQLFGMHYYTKEKQEVFLGAILAFLMAYNDTNNNGILNQGEKFYYVIPYGISNLSGETNYSPNVSAINTEKVSENHYRFGMTYKNLYAKIIDGENIISFWLSTAYPLYIAKFSELTIRYDITIDETNGIVKAETYYKLGQISKLWIFGIPAENPILPDTFGISAVHYLAMFTSNYKVVSNETEMDIDTGIEEEIKKNIAIKVGEKKDSRALTIGYRGTFDLINETNNSYVKRDEKAYNIIMKAKLTDLWLIAWQLNFTVDVFCLMAYALSNDIQKKFNSPMDLYERGKYYFTASAFWYAVAFPSWRGYRVEHDPTYIAYVMLDYKIEEQIEKKGVCGAIVGLIAVLPITFGIVVFKRRKNNFNK